MSEKVTVEKDAYTIPEFLQRNPISRAALYNAWDAGEGPDRMRIGNRILISKEAAERWRRSCEEKAVDLLRKPRQPMPEEKKRQLEQHQRDKKAAQATA